MNMPILWCSSYVSWSRRTETRHVNATCRSLSSLSVGFSITQRKCDKLTPDCLSVVSHSWLERRFQNEWTHREGFIQTPVMRIPSIFLRAWLNSSLWIHFILELIWLHICFWKITNFFCLIWDSHGHTMWLITGQEKKVRKYSCFTGDVLYTPFWAFSGSRLPTINYIWQHSATHLTPQ